MKITPAASLYSDGAPFVFARTASKQTGDIEIDGGTGQATVAFAVPAGCIWSIRMETLVVFDDGAYIDFTDALNIFTEITVRNSAGITLGSAGDVQTGGAQVTAQIFVTHPGTTTNGRVRVVPIFWLVPS